MTTCVHQCLFTGDELEELVDVNELYADIFNNWCHWHRRLFTTGQCVHMCYSGARSRVRLGCESRRAGGADYPDNFIVPFLQGASCVAACDAAAIRAATERGYDLSCVPPNHALSHCPPSIICLINTQTTTHTTPPPPGESYDMVYTCCTSEVTKFIANEQGFRKRVVQRTYEFENRQVRFKVNINMHEFQDFHMHMPVDFVQLGKTQHCRTLPPGHAQAGPALSEGPPAHQPRGGLVRSNAAAGRVCSVPLHVCRYAQPANARVVFGSC